jgi:hypothetical protein
VATPTRTWVLVALWAAAFAVTVTLAVFQRLTGPSHPLRGELRLADGSELSYRLPRSSEGRETLVVSLPPAVAELGAVLAWRRYPTLEPYRELAMTAEGDGRVTAAVPRQPAAGKVEYFIRLGGGSGAPQLPPAGTVVARFRDPVPAAILIPHILTMFASMLVSTRALLEVLRPGGGPARSQVLVAMALLVVGGLVLGPLVQKAAFGSYWTGWPLGTDLTDNKTALAFLAWLPATLAVLAGRRTRLAVAAGWLVMMGVFLIPHSLRGSELDWSAAGVDPAVTRTSPTAGAQPAR